MDPSSLCYDAADEVDGMEKTLRIGGGSAD